MASADTRTPDTDALKSLGSIIDETVKRDAIHLAVEPMTSRDFTFAPGERIGLDARGHPCPAAYSTTGYIAIVDPFLGFEVKRGQSFLALLKPGQIATLRHVWDHPAFPPSDVALAAPAVATSANPHTDAKAWLEQFARTAGVSYDDLIRDAMRWSTYDDEPWWVDSNESYDDFWDKMDTLVGMKLARGTIDFSCRGCD